MQLALLPSGLIDRRDELHQEGVGDDSSYAPSIDAQAEFNPSPAVTTVVSIFCDDRYAAPQYGANSFRAG
jgi:hypothetical protein